MKGMPITLEEKIWFDQTERQAMAREYEASIKRIQLYIQAECDSGRLDDNMDIYNDLISGQGALIEKWEHWASRKEETFPW